MSPCSVDDVAWGCAQGCLSLLLLSVEIAFLVWLAVHVSRVEKGIDEIQAQLVEISESAEAQRELGARAELGSAPPEYPR